VGGSNLADETSEVAVHRVNLVSSIIKEFVVEARLTSKFFDRALKFWQSKMGLTLVNADDSSIQDRDQNDIHRASFIMEGGSIWSRTLSKYRKMVAVNFYSLKDYIYVNVRIDLPGAYRLNARDIDQAIDIIDRFKTELKDSVPGNEVVEGVVAKEAALN